MRTLLFLAGSTLRSSVNNRLSTAAAELARERFLGRLAVESVDLMEYDLPPIDLGVVNDQSLQAMIEVFARADGFFVSADEYTGAFSTQIRLAVNWLMLTETEQRALIAGKPAALVGAAPMGVGGMRGFPALRHLLAAAGMEVLPQQLRPGTQGSPLDRSGRLLATSEEQLMSGALGELVDRIAELEKCSG
ncbi:NADPH-dependent FMN reductase [Mesorhizobium xinjiangense]|uniref:NADPH-dependent FMN reductase n=1 Tax=Mesorhizobium xinjiangense TaxID=2678685 RepID=UPI0012ED6B3A|nr:NAD(P)H-dependent oxidoreductase [Mesorhizobium xinjiangense]